MKIIDSPSCGFRPVWLSIFCKMRQIGRRHFQSPFTFIGFRFFPLSEWWLKWSHCQTSSFLFYWRKTFTWVIQRNLILGWTMLLNISLCQYVPERDKCCACENPHELCHCGRYFKLNKSWHNWIDSSSNTLQWAFIKTYTFTFFAKWLYYIN